MGKSFANLAYSYFKIPNSTQIKTVKKKIKLFHFHVECRPWICLFIYFLIYQTILFPLKCSASCHLLSPAKCTYIQHI